MNRPKVLELQGDDIASAPKEAGVYAWYYRPRVLTSGDNTGAAMAIGQFMNTKTRLEAKVKVRYGLRLIGETDLDIRYGVAEEPAAALVSNALSNAGDFVRAFIQNTMTPVFSKPLYIGIAKVLFNRVYKDHYQDLSELWEPTSTVSRYLSSRRGASVHETLADLGMTHSFAAEARIRGLHPRDLVVFVCPTGASINLDGESEDDSPLLRSIEQVLQLLADPICGRR